MADKKKRHIALLAIIIAALMGAAAAAGYVYAEEMGAATESESKTVVDTVKAETPIVYDVEYDYLGALETWPAEPDSQRRNPFPNVNTTTLVEAGRTVCVEATNEEMNFDGFLDLLKMNPHQTYVIITEAINKLCPGHSDALPRLSS